MSSGVQSFTRKPQHVLTFSNADSTIHPHNRAFESASHWLLCTTLCILSTLRSFEPTATKGASTLSRASMSRAMSLALSSSLLAVGSASGTIVSSLKRKRAGQQEDQLHRSGHIHFSPSLPSYRYSAQHLTTSLASAEDSDKMPQPNPPPTPGSSSDLRGKDTADTAGLTQFRLPPTAYHDGRGRGSSTPSQEGSDSSYRPISPTATGKRPVGAVIGKEDFGLPPPPTRSHKFVKMKPQDEQVGANPATEKSGKAQKGGRKKQSGANGTTAAGRKTARKTAHSLIERRRRSKMNEEFGVLKEMIPACRGQDMHKLAILQVRLQRRIFDHQMADRVMFSGQH